MSNSDRFLNTSVIVTGAGSGFGEATARRFASEGARVLVADINAQGAARVAADITASGGVAQAQTVDVSDESAVVGMVATANDSFGSVDVLVNNAGYSHLNKLLWKISVEEFDAVFAVNFQRQPFGHGQNSALGAIVGGHPRPRRYRPD